MSKAIMKQALSALEPDDSAYREERVDRAISDLRQAIAQSEPEPVMPNGYTTITCPACGFEGGREIEPAYVPLSDEQIDLIDLQTFGHREFARAIEKAVLDSHT